MESALVAVILLIEMARDDGDQEAIVCLSDKMERMVQQILYCKTIAPPLLEAAARIRPTVDRQIKNAVTSRLGEVQMLLSQATACAVSVAVSMGEHARIAPEELPSELEEDGVEAHQKLQDPDSRPQPVPAEAWYPPASPSQLPGE